jgi:uncharacterized protein YfaS (alpha-2-macroglobulin family)
MEAMRHKPTIDTLSAFFTNSLKKMKNFSIPNLIGLLLLTASFLSCNIKNGQQPDNQRNDMKLYSSHYGNDDYGKAWKEIDSLEQQGLPESALKKVEALHERAKADKNPSQIIKTLVYRGKYQSQLEEDGLAKAINRMETETNAASFPTKPILQSMLAEMYQQYLGNHQWKLRDRTQTTPDFKKDDIQTWAIEDFYKQSAALYWASVQDDAARQVPISDFKAITLGGEGTDELRPTLFDFLAHRALDYFMNERSHVSEPAFKFYLDDEAAFAPAKDFAAHRFDTKDPESNKYKTLLLFQRAMSFHANDESPAAHIDADLKRLKFVYDNTVLPNKTDRYMAALKALAETHKDHPSFTEISAALARLHLEQGNQYDPQDKKAAHKWDLKTAKEICEKAIERFPESYGTPFCKQIINEVLTKNLSLQIEEVNPSEKPLLALASYKNIKIAYFKIVRTDEDDAKRTRQMRDPEQIVDFYNSKAPLQSWEHALPDDGDHQQHSLETKLQGLPFGEYIILVSDNKDFSTKNKAVGYADFTVSDMGYFNRVGDNSRQEFIVFDRSTGAPLQGVKAEFFVQDYNSKKREYEYNRRGEGTTDKDGFVTASSINRNDYFQVKFTKGRDILHSTRGYNSYGFERDRREQTTTHLFMDRGIYRPGQTIYFKGLAIRTDVERMPHILSNEPMVVTFYDANYQKIKELSLKTNEYGTFNGTFTAPTTGLLGQMSIAASLGDSRKYFRVEEYKRPKFEVTFKPVEGSYRLNDNLTVKGAAKAFAGSNIDGAKVTYRVVREVRFPYWPWWEWGWRRPAYNSEAMEIANGTTTTNELGEFEIRFAALPDRSVDKSQKPQFDYRVYADVLDMTGETQSNETQISVGYIALSADVEVGQQINKDSFKFINIITNNLGGQFEPAKGSLSIQQLDAPKRAYTKRYWQKPDQFIMSKAEFEQSFPNYAYKDADEPQNWAKLETVFKGDFDTQKDKKININTSSWKTGHYVLTLKTQDKYGEPIELQKQFTLYDLDDSTYPANELFAHIAEKSSYEPGETASYFVGTGDKMLKVLYEVELNGKILSHNWLDVNSLKKLTQRIEEQHRGGLHYHFSYAKNGRAFSSAYTIAVPWSNKDLNIEYSSFRDKLQPGQNEEWHLKISGKKGDKVAAEMLAAMYDASLDQFAANAWNMSLYPSNNAQRRLTANTYNAATTNLVANGWQPENPGGWQSRSYRYFNWFDFPFWEGGGHPVMAMKAMRNDGAPRPEGVVMEDAEIATPMTAAPPPPPSAEAYENDKDGVADTLDKPNDDAQKPSSLGDVQVRTNLNETVFFFPELMTDKDGSVILKFKMNEALTKWKFLGMAHTKDLKYGFTQKEIITQKELMVVPNAPRFFREGDQIEFAAKVSNLSGKDLSGVAQLQLFDAVTMQPVDGLLGNDKMEVPFSAKAGQSAPLKWRLEIPLGKVQAITHRVVARAGTYSDGEESALPVLTNRMLVTESLPLPVRGKQTKEFTFKSLAESGQSSTLQHQRLTLEFTSNPAWYAVQALPYLMEYPYDCTEQVFSRYYANALASHVANAHPKIQQVFERWKGTDALLSNLSKNQELKYALLEETPWVLDAQNEETQKKNIALLFDLNRMADEKTRAIAKIAERQLDNGGFAWFPGGPDSWYITQYLVEGFGHLDKLGVQKLGAGDKSASITKNAVGYIDKRIVEHYEELERRVKKGMGKMEDDNLDYMAMHYLYARTFFLDEKLDKQTQQAMDYYLGQADKYWLKKDLYMQGMLALALQRKGKKETPAKIVQSLKERALKNEELGMYWKYNTGYWWYQLPIETHALMIEVFEEVAKDPQAVDDLKVWLLKNKQTNDWKTTKATASAVYALLMSGDNWLAQDKLVEITLGSIKIGGGMIGKTDPNTTYEPGTGYFKRAWDGKEVQPSMAQVKVANPNTVVAWGGLYWQYFEQLDKIKTFKETPLTIDKKLFIEENSATGPKLRPLAAGTALHPGDKLKVRIELRVDRDMEYVHMKDARASGLEPINVLSQYKWQGGLGYYESTRDASTNFFFDYLPKGTYVFEYPLRVQQRGDFSNGITTIQCMYAPEFTSHSEGVRVKVE